jgi:hypothetical protein
MDNDRQNTNCRKLPTITLNLPAVIGLIIIFLATGAGLVYLLMLPDSSEEYSGSIPTIDKLPSPNIEASSTPNSTPLPKREKIFDCFERVYYTVEEGDTLVSISTEYDIPVEGIIDYNGIIDKNLIVGNILVLPLCKELWATPTN